MSESGKAISSFMKATIVALISIVIVGSIAIFVFYEWQVKKSRAWFDKTLKDALAEGYKIGKESNEQQCLNIIVSRVNERNLSKSKKKANFTQMTTDGLFLKGCLEKSKASNGFCKDIPNKKEFRKSVRWRLLRCRELHLEKNTCTVLLGVIQNYCHVTRSTLGKHD